MGELSYKMLKNAIFRGLNKDELEDLIRKVNFQVLQYTSGEVLVQAGDPCDYLMLLVEGSVSGEMIDFNGKTLKIEDIHAGRPLAIAFIFGQERVFPVSLTANTNTRVIRIWRDDLITLMQLNKVFLHNYLHLISNKAQFLSEKLNFLSFKTIRGKLAHYLLKNDNKDGKPIKLADTQKQMADLFGVARPSVARVMSELEKENIIQTNRKYITILNYDRLNAMR